MSLKHAAMLIAALTVFHYYDRFIVEPAQQQETRQFQQLDAVDVTSIVLVGRNDHFELIKENSIVRDRRQIEMLCQAIRDAKVGNAGHPIRRWDCEVHFVTNGRTWIARTSSTENCGFLLYLNGGNTLRNDSLGPLLEKLAIGRGASN